jgi:hypothetical protein
MTERENILYRIRAKGGLYGHAAEFCMGNEENGDKFIIECFEQCHNESVWHFWGQDLVMDIISYAIRLKSLEKFKGPNPCWKA